MHNLTLGDETQKFILEELKITEKLLARAASKVSSCDCSAEIWAMPDLGIPHDIIRIHGGFYTGGLYTWETNVPMVPIDVTMNCCGVSVFRTHREISSMEHFLKIVRNAAQRIKEKSSYIWNLNRGNHFVIYGKVDNSSTIPNGYYLVLHSSASEFKKQHNGLFGIDTSWYSSEIEIVSDENSHRYLRYITGRTAVRFIKLSQFLEQYNQIRHQYFAETILGYKYVSEEILNLQHYGMPTPNSAAIGCQWLPYNSPIFLLLTAPMRPMFFVKALPGAENTFCSRGNKFILQAHGLGKRSIRALKLKYLKDALVVNGTKYDLKSRLSHDKSLRLRNFPLHEMNNEKTPSIIKALLKLCPGQIKGIIHPIFTYYVGNN